MASDTISITWHIDDVKEVRPDLNKKQCREVLQEVKKSHDATFGVTWDTLKIVADDLFPSN